MSPPAGVRVTRPPLSVAAAQTGLLAALVGERALSAVAPGWDLARVGIVFGLLGLWLAWPDAGANASRRRLLLTPAWGALFAAAGLAWWGLLRGPAAAGLPAWIADWGPWLLVAAVLLLDGQAVRRVARLTRIEALKLARSRLLRLGLLASAGLTLLAGLTHEKLPSETGWSVAAAMLGAGFAVAQVFALVLGATAIAGEASQGTLKMILPHAYRRSDWVLAKALALSLAALLFALLVSGAALGLTAAREGFGDVLLTAEGFGGDPLVTVHASAEAMRSHLLDVLATQLLALLATAGLGLMVSCWLTNVVGALCTAFLAFAALKLGDLVLALDQDTLRSLFPWSPERLREVLAKLGQGLSEGWDERLPTVSRLLSLASGGALLLGGVRLLAKKDLHV